jgi:peptide/nickel transport system substrate-binding protein
MLRRCFWTLLVVSVLMLSLFYSGAYAASAQGKVQYGGKLIYTGYFPGGTPISWDNADWNWRHGLDTGFYIEHLMMGDLQKGPRGSNKFSFKTGGDNIPADCLRGELAEKWEVKKDPLRIVFYLRKGVMWQERPGIIKVRELVADDVVYSMTRLKNSRKALKRFTDIIDRFETKDKYTVIAYLKEWSPNWAYYLGYGYYEGIQAPEQEKGPGGAGQWKNACGTGPFMLEDYKDGHSITYSKNPNYWDSEVIKEKKYKLPFVDKSILMIMKDESTQLAALRTGKLDMCLNLNDRQKEDLKKSTPALVWSEFPPLGEHHIALRMDKRPFNDIRVRRAMNMAIDKNALIKTFYGGEGVLVNIPFQITNKAIYTPLDKLPPAAKELFIYNPEKAKKLLIEAGYPNGFTFKVHFGGSVAETGDYLSMITAMLAKVGITMEIDAMDYPSSLSILNKKTHKDAIYIKDTHGLPLLYLQREFGTGELYNASMISDPRIDKTVDRLNTDPNLTQKQIDAELKKLGVYIMEQAPIVFLPSGYVYTAWWPWVKNYYGEIRVGAHRAGPIFARIWIDQELKKKMGY